jgi:hypothetical protein
MPSAEIALMLQITEQNVRTALHLARELSARTISRNTWESAVSIEREPSSQDPHGRHGSPRRDGRRRRRSLTARLRAKWLALRGRRWQSLAPLSAAAIVALAIGLAWLVQRNHPGDPATARTLERHERRERPRAPRATDRSTSHRPGIDVDPRCGRREKKKKSLRPGLRLRWRHVPKANTHAPLPPRPRRRSRRRHIPRHRRRRFAPLPSVTRSSQC